MKKTLLSLIAGQLLPLLLACTLAAAASKPELQKIKYAIRSSTSERIVLQLNGSYSPKIFTLKGENPRVVFDFPGLIQGREIQNNTATNGTIVKRIRVGMHTDEDLKTRVVFDVASLNGLTYSQKFDQEASTLTIQFTTAAKAAAPETDSAFKKAGKISRLEKGPIKASAQAQPHNGTASEPVEKSTPHRSTQSTEKKDTTNQPSPIAAETPRKKSRPAAKEAPPQTAESVINPDRIKNPSAPTATQPQPVETANPPTTAETATTQPAVSPKAEEGPKLESIKFDGSSPKGEMVLFKLNDFHPPTIHGVEEGIPRVICDFNNTQMVGAAKNSIKTHGKFVKVIRIAKHKNPDRVRVVLDLEPNRSYDLQQVFFKEDNLFVIIVNTIKK